MVIKSDYRFDNQQLRTMYNLAVWDKIITVLAIIRMRESTLLRLVN